MNASEKLIVGQQYARADLYEALEVPMAQRRGNWETGYNQYGGEYFVFVNVETPGRTGHNYNDAWKQDGTLFWHGKINSHTGQPGIKRMLDDSTKCHFFTRVDNSNVYFTYQGIGKAVLVNDISPVEVYWRFPESEPLEQSTQCITNKQRTRRISRSDRMACISHYGEICWVCGFDFVETYGELGEGYIRVCYNDLSNTQAVTDPISQLRPICPNCLAMLHRRECVVHSVDEFKGILLQKKKGSR